MYKAVDIKSMDDVVRKNIHRWLGFVRGKFITEKRRAIYPKMTAHFLGYREDEIYERMIMETENVMVVEIPVRELETMAETQQWYSQNIQGFPAETFDKIIRDQQVEKSLRKKHPGLQECYEKYQIMLALCDKKSFN